MNTSKFIALLTLLMISSPTFAQTTTVAKKIKLETTASVSHEGGSGTNGIEHEGGSGTNGIDIEEGGSGTNGANDGVSIAQQWSKNSVENMKLIQQMVRLMGGVSTEAAVEEYKKALADIQTKSNTKLGNVQKETWIYQNALAVTTIAFSLENSGTKIEEIQSVLDHGYDSIIKHSTSIDEAYFLQRKKSLVANNSQITAVKQDAIDELEYIQSTTDTNDINAFALKADLRVALVENYGNLILWEVGSADGNQTAIQAATDELKASTHDISQYSKKLYQLITILKK